MPAKPIPTQTRYWTPLRIAFGLTYLAAFITLYYVI